MIYLLERLHAVDQHKLYPDGGMPANATLQRTLFVWVYVTEITADDDDHARDLATPWITSADPCEDLLWGPRDRFRLVQPKGTAVPPRNVEWELTP